jgi:sensor c-di-GMP phosphodiesterase-like protein
VVTSPDPEFTTYQPLTAIWTSSCQNPSSKRICDRSLNKLVAEGVEVEEEADVLLELGCHYGQGYLWARPMPADEFVKALENGSSEIS